MKTRIAIRLVAAVALLVAVAMVSVRPAQAALHVATDTCQSPALSALSLPRLAYVGDHPVLKVRLSCAPAKPVRISLASTNLPAPAPAIPLPAKVTVGASHLSASLVLAPKAYLPGRYKSTISASYRGTTLARTITIDPGLSVFGNTGDSCSPNTVAPYIDFTGFIPSTGLTVQLTSDNAAIAVPATVTFTQPGSMGGYIPGVTASDVSTDTKVTLSATLGSRTLTLSILLLRPWQSGDKITLSPDPGSGPFYGPSFGYEYIVLLSHPAPADGNGMTGTATTDHPSDVEIGSSELDVFPGCDNAIVSFDVPYEAHPVHASVTVNIGGSTASASLRIEPSLASVTLPATIVGGQSGTGTVTLAGAPDTKETVFLQSEQGILTVPATVTVPAGHTSVTFPFTTVPVTSDSQVSVWAWHSVGDQMADSVTSNAIDITP